MLGERVALIARFRISPCGVCGRSPPLYAAFNMAHDGQATLAPGATRLIPSVF